MGMKDWLIKKKRTGDAGDEDEVIQIKLKENSRNGRSLCLTSMFSESN